jgi:hypothetical protein
LEKEHFYNSNPLKFITTVCLLCYWIQS